MEEILKVLGFTSLESSIWNIIGYGAFILIIFGVLFEKCRKQFFVLGPFLLAVYAAAFLKNPLFASLQGLITISGLFQLLNLPRLFSGTVMSVMTICACVLLVLNGSITDLWSIMGSLGLLCIVFGIIRLPRTDGFLIMAAGGVLLVAYGYAAGAWVFFLLNIFFAVSNAKMWRKSKTRT